MEYGYVCPSRGHCPSGSIGKYSVIPAEAGIYLVLEYLLIKVIPINIHYKNFSRTIFSKALRENSWARSMQSVFIVRAVSRLSLCTADISSSLVASGERRIPVFPSMIVSRIPHSSTPITGTPQDIDSSETIPKSSFRAINMVAIAPAMYLGSSLLLVRVRNVIFSYHFARVIISSFCGSFSP